MNKLSHIEKLGLVKAALNLPPALLAKLRNFFHMNPDKIQEFSGIPIGKYEETFKRLTGELDGVVDTTSSAVKNIGTTTPTSAVENIGRNIIG
jgi:hypothetical protein